jgi:hypothetical protein
MDAKRLARIGKGYARHWRERKGQAIQALKEMQTDGTPWNERTVAHVTNMKVVELACAEERAKSAPASLTLNLGMVRMPVAIPNHDQWEAFAQSADRPAIEAIVVEPEEDGEKE